MHARCPACRFASVHYRPVCAWQLGGVIGDIESMLFIEAFRQFQFRITKENIVFIHVSLVPQVIGGFLYSYVLMSYVLHSHGSSGMVVIGMFQDSFCIPML